MKLTKKMVLATPSFLLGVKTLGEASPKLLEVLGEVCRHGHTMTEYHQQILAMWAVVDTIRIRESIGEILGRHERVLHLTSNELSWITTHGIQVSWFKNPKEKGWFFTVLLPSAEWREPRQATPLYRVLQNLGFKEEPMEPVEYEVIK